MPHHAAADTVAPATRRPWDPIVRITHWTIALAVLANAVVTEDGDATHIWVGYGLAAILALRLLWGLIGPAEARFSAFWPSPVKALAHLHDIRAGKVTRHASHNPLGALMVYAIWGCLVTIIATGIAMAGPPPLEADSRTGTEHAGVIASQPGEEEHEAEGEEEEGPLGEVHETAANLLYLLILLHLAGVLFETRRSGRQVLVAMAPFQR